LNVGKTAAKRLSAQSCPHEQRERDHQHPGSKVKAGA